MRILDRAIIFRFLANFALLFGLLFIFAASVDTILNLDDYLKAAGQAVAKGERANRVAAMSVLLFQFQGPRLFQFYQFMVGLLCVGAMGFTFVQMHRARELVAIMAAGVPLRRCVWAVLLAALGLNLLQIANQELVLPRIAERLVAGHESIVEGSSSFQVPLTRDSAGNLLYASRFDPESGQIRGFLALERTPSGGLARRITARAANWDPATGSWKLVAGEQLDRAGVGPQSSSTPSPAAPDSSASSQAEPVAEYLTDLSPKALTARHYRLFAQWLSSAELVEITKAGAIDETVARRMQLGRWGSILVNLLVLAVAIPFFLQRGPANMLRQTILCAGVCVPAIIVSAILMAAPVPGLPPTVMVALPVAALVPAACARLGWMPS